ncbi:MAG: dihydropyrimidinase, partial [Clostridia bacterium]
LAPEEGATIVDATGKLVLPGAIDAHTHLATLCGNIVSADDYFTGTRAASCGGTTTVFDFAMQETGERLTDCASRRRALCEGNACVDYAFHVGVRDISGDLLDSLDACIQSGVSSFKMYMVYDFGVTDDVLYRMLEETKKHGALLQLHAENRDLIALLTRRHLAQGLTTPWYHYGSRPEFVESEAISRAILLAQNAGAPLYIVHLACAQGMEAVLRARNAGQRVYAETCPQYLHFTHEVYRRPDGRNFDCSPSIKGQDSQDALWHGIQIGAIDTVATDHCPFQQAEKDLGNEDFSKIPNGCAGIEILYPYMLSEATKGRISYCKAVALCATNVAHIFGCDATKGSIIPGKDADLVLYDPALQVTIHNHQLHGNNDHTIWEGVALSGYPVQTYSRGALVYDHGRFVGRRGDGRFVPCAPLR